MQFDVKKYSCVGNLWQNIVYYTNYLQKTITDFINPFQYDGNLLINLINLENLLKDKKQKRSSPFLFFEKGKRNRINCCKIEPNTISMKLLPHSKTKQDQFTMKALAKNGSLVGHLLEEHSHITKFQLERRINIQF